MGQSEFPISDVQLQALPPEFRSMLEWAFAEIQTLRTDCVGTSGGISMPCGLLFESREWSQRTTLLSGALRHGVIKRKLSFGVQSDQA